MKNFFKTAFLMTLLTVLFISLGAMLGGRDGVFVAFIFALIMNFVSYWFSDKIVLAMYRAKPVTETEFPNVYRIVAGLSRQANIPMPKIYLIPTQSPNAFATGRDPKHATVAFTQGILNILNDDELRGVLAHEIAHVKNRDILIQTVVATIAGAISMIAYTARWAAFAGSRDRRNGANALGILIMSAIAPIAATLIQLAISRAREYQADESGARISNAPLSLASALKKLVQASKQIPMHEANPSSAHLFIVSPLSGAGIVKLFSTHPPLEDRIERLQRLVLNA
ncbi:MAG: zinc metalloprotease HtpX [Candidatus Omnitrophota bacterium]